VVLVENKGIMHTVCISYPQSYQQGVDNLFREYLFKIYQQGYQQPLTTIYGIIFET